MTEIKSDTAGYTQFGYRQVTEGEKADLVQDHFNQVARKYDFANTILSMGNQILWKIVAVNMLHLKPGERVLDVCGGTADLSLRAMKKIGPTGEVVLYDFNQAMIEIGRRKAARTELGRKIRFIQGDAEHLALPDNLFDGAMVGFGIRNLTHPRRGV
jgi:demethylmenaquinone methyltransferase/2-methoxy-6-polyprenyl-1,4-benzoquinol methylase